MAGYPPTPSFGMATNHAASTYRDRSHYEVHDYGDLATEERALLDYQRAQSNAAFQHNASNAPAFSASAVSSGIPPLPIYRDRSVPTYVYSENSLPLNGHLDSRRSQEAYASPLINEPSPNVRPPRDHNLLSHNLASQVTEEGELSEGEYEETGAEGETDVGHVFGTHLRYSQPRDGRLLHLQHTANDQNRDHNATLKAPLIDMYGRSLNLSRQRSESYSPYEPPSQVDYESRGRRGNSAQRRNLSYREQDSPSNQYDHNQSREYKSRSPLEKLMVQASEATRGVSAGQSEPVPGPNLPSYLREDPNRSMKSVANARKEAQNAILNLLPLKVRFHDYIEEGIDEEIVLRQFDHLGMAPTSLQLPSSNPQPANRLGDISNMSKNPTSIREPMLGSPGHSNFEISGEKQGRLGENALTEIVTNAPTQAPPPKFTPHLNNNTGEERKDRIARLLAEKKQKQASPAMGSDAPITSASVDAAGFTKPTPNAQAAAKADKERLILQKMEALQKSREQRAQKAAAKSLMTQVQASGNKTTTDRLQEPGYVHATEAPPTSLRLESIVPPKSASPVKLVGSQQMPSIPGLFLASGKSNSPTPTEYGSSNGITQNSNLRKRPVASDFDEIQPIGVSYKRPFGQSRNDKPLVIDVSDEESDNDELSSTEVDQSQDDLTLPPQPQCGSETLKHRTTRDLPPLSDFPPRRTFTLPASTASTPPALQQTSKILSRKPEDLQKKEKEIQDMRRKIAEAERRKMAKQNLSGSQTPASNYSTSSPAKSGSGTGIVDKIDSVEIERLINTASRHVDQNQQKLAEARRAEQFKADENEQRRLRRAKIATDLPVVDAEVEKAQKKLDDLRAEMAKMEAAVQQGLIEKRRLADEMEKLSQEADEPPKVHNNLEDIQVVDNAEMIASDTVSDGGGTTVASLPAFAQESANQIKMPFDQTMPEAAFELGNADKMAIDVPDARLSSSPVTSPAPLSRNAELSVGVHTLQIREGGPETKLFNASSGEVLKPTLAGPSGQDAPQPLVQFRADSDSEMDYSYAPNPKAIPILTESPIMKDAPSKVFNECLDEHSNTTEGESDTYEPPEATPPLSGSVVSSGSPPFSPAPPEDNSGITDIDTQDDSLSINAINRGSLEPTPLVENISLPAQQADQVGNIEHHSTHYTPYESPLKYFHAFRFHPSFKQEVKGSFKSLTYSNKIQADQEICRYELAGGVCNDPSCEFQHFRDMELADNVILVELGNSAGYSEIETPKWIIGLRAVLQSMREKKTIDFEIIASQIIAHRNTFLKDASRVLPLGGISV